MTAARARIPFSVLDVAPIVQGSDAAQSFKNSLDLAQHAERWGYRRYWLAEHHNIPAIASAATAVLIGHIAGGTSTLRVGSGGVMLPNHSPLVIAEQFGTLASLFPRRIDLGVGRAPGTDGFTAQALRRNSGDVAESFPSDVVELQSYFQPPTRGQQVRAIPGAGLQVPLWILGSSPNSAQLAAHLGLPYSFATFLSPPGGLGTASTLYRQSFKPSVQLAKPYLMPAVIVVAADTDAEANHQLTTLLQLALSFGRGNPAPLQPPRALDPDSWSPLDRMMVSNMLSVAVVGGPATVQKMLAGVVADSGADELMCLSQIFDHSARLRCFEILAQVRDALGD
jgi:luciferase family oxidoreductase group 1